jgi:mono/diheme cytochrome c family protein
MSAFRPSDGNEAKGMNKMIHHTRGRVPRGLACIFAAVWIAAASPSAAADASHGEQLARRWCATCHVVGADQRQTTGEAPPFAVISRTPEFDANKLAFYLLGPHPKMPDMSLTRFEAGDLAAYIGSLAK